MSEIIEALILGIVQGLTEFLPISSSGHLEIAKVLLNDDSLSTESMLVTVILHFATACATIYVFRDDILKLFKNIFAKDDGEGRRYMILILVSMIPAVCVGLLFDEFIESLFNKNILLVGSMLLVTAIFLLVSDYSKKQDGKLTILNAFAIGLAQAIAILPGISRSGATIASSVLMGINREDAAKFSFLMVVPLIFGKMAKDVMDGQILSQVPSIYYLIVGFISAFVFGVIACKFMLVLVKKAKLRYFSIYCTILAVVSIIFYYA